MTASSARARAGELAALNLSHLISVQVRVGVPLDRVFGCDYQAGSTEPPGIAAHLVRRANWEAARRYLDSRTMPYKYRAMASGDAWTARNGAKW